MKRELRRESMLRKLHVFAFVILTFSHSSMAFTFEQHIWGDCGGITPSFIPGKSQVNSVVSGYRDEDKEWRTRAERHGLILGDGSVAKIINFFHDKADCNYCHYYKACK